MAENQLWQYSLSVYSKPDVEPLLLQLQDDFGADVNLLLCAFWLSSQRYVLDVVRWSSLVTVSASWRTECILPLRSVRRFLKSRAGVDAFREQVKALEIDAEHCQQDLLYQQLLAMNYLQFDQRDDALKMNVAAYTGFLAGVDKPVLTALLEKLQRAVLA